MGKIHSISGVGLQRLALHEGLIRGIYDCPARHATYGIGTLVHHGPSQILRIVQEAKPTDASEVGQLAAKLKPHLRSIRISKKSSISYLAAEVGEGKTYRSLVDMLLASKEAIKKEIVLEDDFLTKGWESYMSEFGARLGEFERAVAETFATTNLSQDQFDGLVSIAYNIGATAMRNSGELVSAVKAFCGSSQHATRSDIGPQKIAATLLEAILRARPTARAPVTVEIDSNSFSIMQPGVFNPGLFNRRVSEASLIMGRSYSTTDTEIIVAKRIIKADKDHYVNARAKTEAAAIVKILNTITQVHRRLP